MKWAALLLLASACDFNADYATYCGNTGRCGVQLRASNCQSSAPAAAASLAVSLAGIQQGDLLVLTINRFQDPMPDPTALSDSLGTNFQPAFNAKTTTDFWTRTYFGTASADAGNDQLTATFSSTKATDLFFTAFANVQPPAAVDTTASSPGPAPGTLTTTVPDELMYATAIADNSVSSVSPGFQSLVVCNQNMAAWRAGGAPGAYAPSFTVDGGEFLSTGVSFR